MRATWADVEARDEILVVDDFVAARTLDPESFRDPHLFVAGRGDGLALPLEPCQLPKLRVPAGGGSRNRGLLCPGHVVPRPPRHRLNLAQYFIERVVRPAEIEV